MLGAVFWRSLCVLRLTSVVWLCRTTFRTAIFPRGWVLFFGAFRVALPCLILVLRAVPCFLLVSGVRFVFTLGGAAPIVHSCASITSLRFSACHFLLRAASSLHRFHWSITFSCRGLFASFCHDFVTHILGGGLHTGAPSSFWLSVALWRCCLRWLVAVHSKQVGSLAPVLCVCFRLAACCLVVACLGFALCALCFHPCTHSKDKTWGWWHVLGKKVGAPIDVVVDVGGVCAGPQSARVI